jgi:hypothetical protein
MRRHHTGSGRRTAVPVDWEATHAPIVTAQWQTEATVALRKPGGTSAWDEALGRTKTVPFLPFVADVPAKISPITANDVNVVDERAWVLGYRVALPRDVAPTPGQLDEGIEVVVQTCSDPMLVGVTMRVSEVVRGTHRFERELVTQVNS